MERSTGPVLLVEAEAVVDDAEPEVEARGIELGPIRTRDASDIHRLGSLVVVGMAEECGSQNPGSMDASAAPGSCKARRQCCCWLIVGAPQGPSRTRESCSDQDGRRMGYGFLRSRGSPCWPLFRGVSSSHPVGCAHGSLALPRSC